MRSYWIRFVSDQLAECALKPAGTRARQHLRTGKVGDGCAADIVLSIAAEQISGIYLSLGD